MTEAIEGLARPLIKRVPWETTNRAVAGTSPARECHQDTAVQDQGQCLAVNVRPPVATVSAERQRASGADALGDAASMRVGSLPVDLCPGLQRLFILFQVALALQVSSSSTVKRACPPVRW